MLLAEVKNFNVLIESKPCIDEAVKNKQEAYESQEMAMIQKETY